MGRQLPPHPQARGGAEAGLGRVELEMDLTRMPWGGALGRVLAVLGMAAAARAQAPAVGYCEAPNPFSGALDCTQFAGGSAAVKVDFCGRRLD